MKPVRCLIAVALAAAASAALAGPPYQTDDPEPTSPCGVCRQVMSELAPGARVIMAAAPEKGHGRLDMTVEELLPHGFSFLGHTTQQPGDDKS